MPGACFRDCLKGTRKRCLVAKKLSFSKKRPTGTFSRLYAWVYSSFWVLMQKT